MPDTLPKLAAQAWTICPEARPTRPGYHLDRWCAQQWCWKSDETERTDSIGDEDAHAAIFAQCMACIFAWPIHRGMADALDEICHDTGPLAERCLRAIIAIAPSVPEPRPKPLGV